jgi:hypothetical protein
MSPTWSDVDGETFHKFGAVAYTSTENNDAEIPLNCMEATTQATGSENGLVDQLSHYCASLFNPNNLYTGNSDHEPFPLPDKPTNEDEEEDYANSQDYLPPMNVDGEDQTDTTSSKSSNSISPAKKCKVDK